MGQRLVFFSATQFEPTASTGETEQVFLSDDPTKTFRQLTGRAGSGDAPAPFHLSVNADASILAYETDSGAALVQVASAEITMAAEKGPAPYVFTMSPSLSADGNRLAVVSAANLDPSVGNEDLNPEVFVSDLSTGVVNQVTDNVSDVGSELSAIDQAAENLVVNSGARATLRRRPNRAPMLDVAPVFFAEEGKESTLELRATDADADPITLQVQFPFADPQRRTRFGTTIFTDLGNGALR